MKLLSIFFILTILTSCFGKKQKDVETNNIEIESDENLYELLIHEVIEYNNSYEKDTLLIKVEVLHYRETLLKERETWHFEYGENNQLISEKHFLHKGDLTKLVYNKEVSDKVLKIIEFDSESNDTLSFDQYQYDNRGNLINHKSKFKMNRTQRDSEYFDYEYDRKDRIVQMKDHSNIIIEGHATNKISNIQYKYEVSGDTIIKYRTLDSNLSSVEKTISIKKPETIEIYSYDLPGYELYTYEKKIVIDKDRDSYIHIKSSGDHLSIDSTFMYEGKKIKHIEHYPGEIYYMYKYEYDDFGNLTKEIRYMKLEKN